ncbi:hypothetical protein ACFB49_40010 [Sphingomonas sp. DBB INV C78]|uniref:energy transducer TonB n=1 Tax=Sphingomonas sp. DBB INV C78 TaxID=3349434 RepID=UPI0036D355E5
MQQQGGFLDQGNKSPTSMMLVAGMHVAAIGALILFPPKFIRETPTVLTGYIVPPDEPPPPNPPPPSSDPKSRDQLPITNVSPIVETGATTEPTIPTQGPITPPFPGPITEPIPDPTPPAPILADATVDPRAPFQPSYPPRLARQEINGNAVVRVLIGSDGRVKAVEMVSATDPEFFEATKKQALRFWRFKPATRDGLAVESWRTMTVRFEMKA